MKLLYANDRLGEHAPSWYAATAEAPGPYPELTEDIRADVVVIGGGYTGLSAALCLAEAGMDVVLLEAQRIGFGASGRNGGQVGTGQRVDQLTLEMQHGRDAAKALWDIAEDAKREVAGRIATHDIGCSYKPGVAFAARSEKGAKDAADLVDFMAQRYGYEQGEALDQTGIEALVGSSKFKGGLIDWGAGHLHPLQFAFGLARAAVDAGVRIFEKSEVLDLGRGDPVVARTATGAVTADFAILGAGGYLPRGLAKDVDRRVMPINNFIVATEPLSDRANDILSKDIAVADDRFVVSYWRLSEDKRLLFGGGETYGYRFPSDIAAVVRKPMEEIYPQLKGVAINYAWGGTLSISLPRLPYFARLAPNVLSASGYSGHGVALATLAGRMMAETIRGQAERFDVMAALDPPVFPGGAWLRSPVLATAMTWYALRDRLGI